MNEISNIQETILFSIVEFSSDSWNKHGIYNTYQEAIEAYELFEKEGLMQNGHIFQIEEMPVDSILYASETTYENDEDETGQEKFQVYGIFTNKDLVYEAFEQLNKEGIVTDSNLLKVKEFSLNEKNYFYLESQVFCQ